MTDSIIDDPRTKFEIKLPLFEGPFDLLLFFIERDELDIYDIPIATITRDFLDYLHQMKKMNVEVASEFILVAATLMRIKAKMLIPRPVLDESGNVIDPREVQDLDLYKLMKVFHKVLNSYELQKNKPIHQVIPYPYTIESQKEVLIQKLYVSKNQRISFEELLAEKPEKILAIFNFLALLELLQLKKIMLHLGEGFNNFWVESRISSL